MKLFQRLICRLLIGSTILLPFSVDAGMIGTDQAIASAQDLAHRDKVRDLISRESIARQLEAMGISSATAQARVNAMTQEEINKLAGNIDTLPAAGFAAGWGWVIALLFVAGFVYSAWGPGGRARW